METRWLYHTSETVPTLVDEAKGVCVIPMGCVEKHGLHLPLGTDIMVASHVAYLASQMEPVCVFPDFTFGDYCNAAPGQPAGTVTLPVETEVLLLEQLCEQISRNGMKKILVLSCHGGNKPWLATFLRKMYNKKRDFVVTTTNAGRLSPDKLVEILQEKGSGSIPELTPADEQVLLDFRNEGKSNGHAGFNETSYILGIAPETVHLDRLGIESGLPTHLTDHWRQAGVQIVDSGWSIEYPNNYSGHDPIGCNERIGKAAVRVAAERVAGIFRMLKEDNDLLKWHNEMQKGW